MPDVRSRRVAAWEWLSSSYGRLRDWGGEARRWQLGSAYAYLVHSRLRRDVPGNCTRELWRARRAIETALRKGSITIEESARLRRRYEQGLSGYTYLDVEDAREALRVVPRKAVKAR